MTSNPVRNSQEFLQAAVASENPQAIRESLDSLDPGEAVHAIYQLSDIDQSRMLTALPRTMAAELVADLPEAQAAQMIERLPAEQAARIVAALPSNEQADMIARLPDLEASRLLEALPLAEAQSARRLLAYPPQTAGRLMITEYLAYKELSTVGDVLDDLRANADRYRHYDVQYAYVLSMQGQLRGVLRLRDVVLSDARTPVSRVMIDNPRYVFDTAKLDELERFFDRHPLFAAPVIDDEGVLMGVVLNRTIEEAAEERSSRSFLSYMGIVGGEELRTMSLRTRTVRRMSWLSANIGLNLISASVIAFHQATLSAVIALVVFLPIISDMSGCSGNQAVAVSMRELTLGLIRPKDLWKVLGKEMSVGIINGLVLGLLLGLIGWVWQGNVMLGAVVAVALAVNTLVAVCIGGSIPLLLQRLGQDPALAAGPILTTITDMSGFFLVLSLAGAVLPWLTK